MSVEFTCDLENKGRPLPHFWEHTVGSGHALLALRADWQAQLRQCHEELGFGHVRFHGLLCDDVGTFVIEQDKPVYSFLNSDRIFDFLLSIGMKPFVELSFMPEGLASGPQIVFHYRGNITPPKDYKAWATMIRKLVRHWIDRYGVNEVRQWFFEVWNEPNLEAFWTGTREEYFKLYTVTAQSIKEQDSLLRVGGPATAMNAWIAEFVDFCQAEKVPVDFVSTHHYPTDAMGKPGDDTLSQLAASPRSVLREQAAEAKRQAGALPLYYTEWNASSNPADQLHDLPYTAAFIVKTVMEANGLVDGYSFWTFTDIFEENYFRSVPFHGGFGLLTLYDIPKPSYRAYEILHSLGNELLDVQGDHKTVDAWCVRDDEKVTVLLTNWERPRHEIQRERVTVRLKSAAALQRANLSRIDQTHANAYQEWRELGKPEYLNHDQVARLKEVSELQEESCELLRGENEAILHVELEPQSVTAINLESKS